MAKRRRGGSMGTGGNRGGGRKPGAGRGQQRAAASDVATGISPERMRGSARGGNSRRAKSRRGMVSGARKAVLSIGESTAETARQFASGATIAAKGVARGTQAAVGKVRDNPWPSLLIGAGVTWLAVDAVRGRGSENGERDDSGPGIVRRAASGIADASKGAGEAVGDFVRERPFLAGAATLGIGMAVAMAMPSTSAEDSMMGRARDNVVRRAKDAARGTMDAMREVADNVERIAGGGGRERMR